MVLKHYPLGDVRFGIRFIVNSNIYPVCQSLKNKLRTRAGQTVIAEYVPNFLFQIRMGACYSGPWIFGLSLFFGLALGFFFVWVPLWVSGGAAWLLDFVFRLALGYGSWGKGKLRLFVGDWGFWGLGAGALVISDYK